MKKRIMALLTVAVMLLSFFPSFPVYAAENPTFAVDTVTAEAGQTVDVAIWVKNNPGITSIKLSLEFDDALTLESVAGNPELGKNFLKSPDGNYPVILNWYDGWDDITGDWYFAILSFTVADDAVAGTYPITITHDPNDVFNVVEDNVLFNIENGAVVVEAAEVAVSGVTLNQTALSLTEGETATLTAAVTPADATNQNVTFTSSNPQVATVDPATGKVTALKEGSATITVTTEDGGMTATCAVTVACAHGSKTEVPSKSADCDHPGNYLYFVCNACGQAFKADGVTKTTAEEEIIPAVGHSYTEKVEDAAHLVPGSGADCQSVKQYYYDCAHCDKIGTETWNSTTVGEHKLSTSWTTENGKHFHECTVNGCDHVADEASCSGGTATCTELAKCSVCNVPYGELAQHEYKTEWNQGDASGHWHDCANCSAHTAAEVHTPNVDAATEETAKYCTVCGYVMEAQLDHTHKTSKVEGKAATCTEDGYKTYYTCTCGKWFEDSTANIEITDKNSVVLAKLGHDLSDATCTAPATCRREGCTYTEGTALGHDWTEKLQDAAHVRSEAANCTEHDTYWYDCSRCDEISTSEYYETATTGAHSYTEKVEDAAHLVPGSGADCQSVKQYYYDCAHCDKIGTETWNSTTVGEHKLSTSWTTENGKHFHECTVNGCDHVADEASCSGGTATCTELAKCSVCNVPYGELAQHEYKTEWNQGDASGHWHDCANCSAHTAAEVHTPNVDAATEETAKFCTVCGYVMEAQLDHTHKTSKVEGKAATCTEDGHKTYYTCTCGKWFEDSTANIEITDKNSVVLAKLGHDLSDATCTAPATCRREGCTYTEGTALGHDWTEKLQDAAHVRSEAANCTEHDTYWYDCSRCDEISTSEYYEIATTGAHSYTEKVEDAAHLVPGSGADCQSVKQYYYDCAHCDKIGTSVWDSTTVGAHKMSASWTTENGKHFHECTVNGCDHVADEAACSGGTATCTELAKCSVCNVPYGELAKHEYKTEWNQGDASGHWHDCANCSAHTAAEAHTPNVDAATEETAKYCTVCGYVMEAQLDHTHKTSKVEGKAATCTEDGYKTYYTCTCGKWFEDSTANIEITDKNSVVLAKLGHDLSDATCTEPATCQREGCTYTEGTALGHDWTEKIQDAAHVRSEAANCTEHDTYWYDCSRCDEISTSEYYETTAGEHSFTLKAEDAEHLASAGDCQNVKTYFYGCEHCDAISTETWNSTTVGEHKLSTSWTTENGKHFHACTVSGCDHVADEAACSGGTATCTELAKCSVCNGPYGELAQHEYKTEWNRGDASGHWHDCANCSAHTTPVAHIPGAEATEYTAQTCTECGYVITPALGHTHSVTEVKGWEPTCTENGQQTYYTCTCGKWFKDMTALVEIVDHDSVIIPALGHDLSDATCTEPATCQREGCTYTEGTAPGHNWKDATCTDPETCAVCGQTQGEALGHGEFLWMSDSVNHWKACANCGEELEGSKAVHRDADGDGKCDCGHDVADSDPSSPQTGDNSHIGLWITVMAVSAVACVAVVFIGKKRNNAAK